MALVGWDVEPRVVAAGETLHLTLYWECLAPMASDYQVSTQVVRADQLKAAQMDAAPGGVPTGQWSKGQQISGPARVGRSIPVRRRAAMTSW